MAIDTPKLHLLLIQENWKFADDSFNAVIEDMDNKLLGIAHANSKVHWDEWNTGYSYSKGDVIRTESCKSNQYYLCVTNGISGTTEPTNDITGSVVNDGTVQWKVCIIGDSEASASVDIFRGGLPYTKGQLVLYNDVLYRCKIGHVAAQTMELDESYWQQVDASLQPWKASTYFLVNDIVVYDNVIYKCTTAHTSGYNFDYTKWTPLTITLIENWATSTRYVEKQIVIHNGEMFRALDTHTSDATSFATDLAVPHWEYITNSLPSWVANEGYLVGQVAVYNNRLYKCKTAHTATGTFDPTKWTPILALPVVEEWQPNTSYLANQLILSYGMLLKAIDAHTSDSTSIITDMDAANNNNHWTLVYANIVPWQQTIVYKVGAQVIYNNNLYKAKDTHTSGNSFDISHWDLIGQFDAFLYNWQANKYYYANQVVVVDKELYRNTTPHTSAGTWDSDKSNWVKISAETLIEPWESNTEYLVSQVVVVDGILYRCITKHTSGVSFDTSKWTPVYATIAPWQASTPYRVGEYVVYNNQIYKCLTAHTSSSSFEPNGSNWQPISNNIAGIPVWASGVYYYPNQVVRYNGKIYRCVTAHISGNEEKPDLMRYYTRESKYLDLDQDSNVPVYFTADIGSIIRVTKIREEHSGGYFEANCDIKVSIDGTNYVVANTFHASDSGSSEFDTYADARYVRLSVLSFYIRGGGSGSMDFNNLYVWGDSNKWEVILDPSIRITYWSQNTRYKVNDIVLYDNEFYKCIVTNDSGTSFDSTKWRKIPDIVIPNWTANTAYKVNQIVFYDNKLYKCTTAHTSGNAFDSTKWTPVNDTVDVWSSGKNYYIGQVVWHNNSLYMAIVSHISSSDRTPSNMIGYENTGIEKSYDDTMTLPISLVIDLGSVYKINNVSFDLDNVDAGITEMSVDYSEDSTNYDVHNSQWSSWITGYNKNMATDTKDTYARYIRIVVETIDVSSTPWNVDLKNLKIQVENTDDWEEVSTMNVLTSEDIADMFI